MATTTNEACRGHHGPDLAGTCALCGNHRTASESKNCIKIPDGLTLSDLLDAIDSDRRRTVGSSIARNRGADAYPHSFGYLVSSVANFLADRRSVDELRQALATVELITMRQDSYAHFVAMADDRRDAVEHAARLTAERSIEDDGPVAA